MSLVDYASSDDDVPAAAEEEQNPEQPENHRVEEPQFPKHEPQPQPPPLNQ